VSYFVLVLVLSAVTWRVTRFLILDTLLDTPRDWVHLWLQTPHPKRWVYALKIKVFELISCPYCTSVWVAAGAVLLTRPFVDGIPLPVWTWLAVATGAMIIWDYVDKDQKIVLETEDSITIEIDD
jgi:hypothetical protein